MILALLLATGATAPADASEMSAYPAAQVLKAFATACSGVENPRVNLASVEAAGWERLAPDADTPVSRLARAGTAAVIAQNAKEPVEDRAAPLPGTEFRKQVAGRTLYLALSGVKLGTFASYGCRVYDFSAPRALTSEEIKDWTVLRDPTSTQSTPQGVVRAMFEPGMKPGHMAMEVFFVPQGATPVPGFELSGLSLVASAMESGK